MVVSNETLLTELRSMRKEVDRISEAISGNPMRQGDHGISGDVEQLDHRLSKLEDKATLGKGFWMGMMAAASVMGGVITFLIQTLFKKD